MEEEINRHQEDVDALNRHAEELKSKGAQTVVEPSLLKLNRRWHEIQAQFAQFNRSPTTNKHSSSSLQSPSSSSSPSSVVAAATSLFAQERGDPSGGDAGTSSGDDMTESVTRTVVTTVTTTHVTRVVFSKVPSKFTEEVEKLLHLITDIQEELQSPVLHGQQYEDFSRQEDKLKVGHFGYVVRKYVSECSFCKMNVVVFTVIVMSYHMIYI